MGVLCTIFILILFLRVWIILKQKNFFKAKKSLQFFQCPFYSWLRVSLALELKIQLWSIKMPQFESQLGHSPATLTYQCLSFLVWKNGHDYNKSICLGAEKWTGSTWECWEQPWPMVGSQEVKFYHNFKEGVLHVRGSELKAKMILATTLTSSRYFTCKLSRLVSYSK